MLFRCCEIVFSIKNGMQVSHGVYSFCFGNQFSTVTHKQVYFSLHPKRLESLAEEAGNPEPKAHTMLESMMENIHAGGVHLQSHTKLSLCVLVKEILQACHPLGNYKLRLSCAKQKDAPFLRT